MAEEMESNNGNAAFTNKEMWVRVDAKLDTLVSRQQHFDIELALLKERQHQAERIAAEVKGSLKAAEELMAKEVSSIKAGQLTVLKAVRWATAVVIGSGIIIDAVVRFYRG